MARAHWVKSSRKEHTCSRGHVIPKGDGYYWAKPGFRRRTPIIRCKSHPFRPSELTTSARSEPMSAVEEFEDSAAAGFDSIEDLESAWEELRSAVEEYRDQRQEALDQWEYGNSQLEELLDTAQSALDEVEGFTPDEYSEEEPSASEEEAHEEWEQGHREHIDTQTDEALEVALSLEF